MDTIKIMISSVVKNFEPERNAIKEAFKDISFVTLIGVDPFNSAAYASSSSLKTVEMARDCDLYILVLSNDFGYELQDGKSATEVEFDAAFQKDPTKILVFLKKDSSPVDSRQEIFVNKVCDYYSGYWRPTFSNLDEIHEIVKDSFINWLKDRAAIGKELTYLDHFARLVKQYKPEPNASVYYVVNNDRVELEYRFWNKTFDIHFEAQEIYKDFWGCISQLQLKFREWTK